MNTIKNMTLLFLFTILITSVYGGEVTGAGFVKSIMQKKEMSLQQMLNNGHALLLGEVTGAGKPISLDKVKVVITSSEAFKMSNVQRIEFKKSGGLKLQNVDFFEINGQVIDSQEIKALVVKK